MGAKLGGIILAGSGLLWLLAIRTPPAFISPQAAQPLPDPVLVAPPMAGLTVKDLADTFDQMRGANRHEAIDLMEPWGTPVLAVVDGTIIKLFLSKPGGNTIYLFDNDQAYCYYYAHLDHYAAGLHEGQHVSPGDVIAYVGSTGNANPAAPHLHFTIFELGPERRWWKGTPINPYPILMRLVNSRHSRT
jgi:murein DD-endopeptidase MepM/ murein hydrolase activator NlpD